MSVLLIVLRRLKRLCFSQESKPRRESLMIGIPSSFCCDDGANFAIHRLRCAVCIPSINIIQADLVIVFACSFIEILRTRRAFVLPGIYFLPGVECEDTSAMICPLYVVPPQKQTV